MKVFWRLPVPQQLRAFALCARGVLVLLCGADQICSAVLSAAISQRDGCPKIINLGSAKTDLFYERKKYGEQLLTTHPCTVCALLWYQVVVVAGGLLVGRY